MKKIVDVLGRLVDAEERMQGTPFARGVADFFGSGQGFFLAFLFILCVYTFKVDLHPGFHGDEQGILAIPYRAVTYGDYSYPLVFSDTHNAGAMRHYPPAMAMTLRNAWHHLVGFSDLSSRIFSGLLMAVLSGLIGWLAFQRSASNWRFAVLALVSAGLSPALLVSARTVRFEQEIVFMGALSFLLPLLALRSGHSRWLNAIIWILSGLCLSWAGTSHPYGLVFAAVMGLSFLFCHKAWKAQDDLHPLFRIVLAGIGCLPPAAVTVLQVMQDWPAFLSYMKDVSAFYAERNDQLIDYFLRRYRIPLEPGFPGRVAASILMLHMNGFAASATRLSGIDIVPVAAFFQVIYWGFIAAIFMRLRGICESRNDGRALAGNMIVALAAGFVIFSLLYTPNQTYYIYSGLFVIAGGIALQFSGNKECRFLRAGLRTHALLCVLFAITYGVFLLVSKDVSATIPLDTRHAALRQMSAALQVEKRRGYTYVDSATWPAAGKSARAYLDVMRSGKTPDLNSVAALVVTPVTYSAYIERYAEKWEEGKNPLSAVLKGKVLRGVVVVGETNTAHNYYLPAKFNDRIFITLLDGKTRARHFSTFYRHVKEVVGEFKPGFYLLLLPPGEDVSLEPLKTGQTPGLKVWHHQKAQGMPGAALIELAEKVRLPNLAPNIVMLPLQEGWQ